MAIIYSYPTVTPVKEDLILGTDVSAKGNPTKNFTIESIIDLVTIATGDLQFVLDLGNVATGRDINLTNSAFRGGSFVTTGGATVSGTTGVGFTNVTSTAFTGTIATAAQPNITSLGALTGLVLNGPISGTGLINNSNLTGAQNDNVVSTLAIKTYVDNKVGLYDTLQEILANGNTTGGSDIVVSAGDDITFTDTSKILMGTTSTDNLEIYNDSANSIIIDKSPGALKLQTSLLSVRDEADTIQTISANAAGAVELYHVGDKKIETLVGGAKVTGAFQATTSGTFVDLINTGTYSDSSGDVGTAGQILSSTGTGTNWVTEVPLYNWSLEGTTIPSGTAVTVTDGTNITTTWDAANFDLTIATTGVPDGSGAANQVTYWSDTDTLTGAAGFTFAGGATGKVAIAGELEVGGVLTDGTFTGSSGTYTGYTSITSTDFVGALTGNASTATALASGGAIAITGDTSSTGGPHTYTSGGAVTIPTTIANTTVTAKTLLNLPTPTSAAIAASDTILDAMAKLQGQITGLAGSLAFEGTWNANTDTPTLSGTTPSNGTFYIVSVAGTTDLDGITDWQVGDWAIYVDNGAGTNAWQKLDQSNEVLGSGAQNKIAKWTSTNTLATGLIADDGTDVTIGNSGNLIVQGNTTLGDADTDTTSIVGPATMSNTARFNIGISLGANNYGTAGQVLTSGGGSAAANTWTTVDNYQYWVLSDGTNTTNINATDTATFTGASGITVAESSGTITITGSAQPGTGTQYTLPVWSTTSSLGDSMVSQNAGGTELTVSGKVGIGTSSLDAKLSLYHATDNVSINVNTGTGGSYPKKTGISFGATSTSLGGDSEFKGGAGIQAINTASSNNPTDLAFWTTGGGSPTEKMRITSGGELQVTGNGVIKNQESGGNYTYLQQTSSDSRLFVQYSQPLLFGTNATEKMRIDSSGHVSIGQDVGGSAFNGASVLQLSPYTSGQPVYIGLKSNASNNCGILMGDSDDSYVGGFIYNNPNNYLVINTNNAERMRIDSSGNVTVNNGNVQLVDSNKRITVDGSDIRIWQRSNADIQFLTNDLPRMLIDGSGNVGINDTVSGNFTTNYDTKLLVGGEIIARSLTASASMISIGGDSTSAFIKVGKQDGSQTARPLRIEVGTSEAMSIDSSGDTTFTGNVISLDTFYLQNSSGKRWQQLFDGDNWNLRYYNGTSWSADALAIDTSNNSTFAGDIIVNKLTTATGLEYQVRNANGASGNHVFKSYNTAILTLDGGTNDSIFAGNVGIGTDSPSEILQTNKNSAGNIVGGYFTNSQANTGAESVSLAFGLNRSGGDFVRQVKAITFGAEQQWTGTPSTVDSYLAFSTISNETVAERMRIASDGAVTLKPDGITTGLRLQGRSSDNNFFIQWNSNNGSTNYGSIGNNSGQDAFYYSFNNHVFTNSNSGTEYMRIDSNGALALPRLGNDGFINFNSTDLELDVNRDPNTGAFSDTAKSHARISLSGPSGGSTIKFMTASANNTVATQKFSIDGNGQGYFVGGMRVGGLYITALQGNAQLTNASTSSGSNPSYIGQGLISVSISDVKSKENFSDVQTNECLNKIVSLADHVKKFDWIDEDWKREKGRTVGMVAQEIYEDHGEFVHKPENYDDDGWAIRYQEIVPTLIKSIQELKADNDSLKARIETLENN